MSNEEIRSRERMRDVVTLQLTTQRAHLHSKAKHAQRADSMKNAARKNFDIIWKTLKVGKIDGQVAPLVAAELTRRERSLQVSTASYKAARAETDTEATKLRRLEAVYLNLSEQIGVRERAIEENNFESALEDRTGIINDARDLGSNSLSNSSSPSSEIRDTNFPRIDSDRGNGFKQSNFREKKSDLYAPPRNPQPTVAPTLVRDLKTAFASQYIDLSHVDTWRRLDETGVRLELTLVGGKRVSLSVSRAGSDGLTVQLSRAALPSGAQLGDVRSAILKSLSSQGLKVKQFIVTDEDQ